MSKTIKVTDRRWQYTQIINVDEENKDGVSVGVLELLTNGEKFFIGNFIVVTNKKCGSNIDKFNEILGSNLGTTPYDSFETEDREELKYMLCSHISLRNELNTAEYFDIEKFIEAIKKAFDTDVCLWYRGDNDGQNGLTVRSVDKKDKDDRSVGEAEKKLDELGVSRIQIQ